MHRFIDIPRFDLFRLFESAKKPSIRFIGRLVACDPKNNLLLQDQFGVLLLCANVSRIDCTPKKPRKGQFVLTINVHCSFWLESKTREGLWEQLQWRLDEENPEMPSILEPRLPDVDTMHEMTGYDS